LQSKGKNLILQGSCSLTYLTNDQTKVLFFWSFLLHQKIEYMFKKIIRPVIYTLLLVETLVFIGLVIPASIPKSTIITDRITKIHKKLLAKLLASEKIKDYP